MEGAINSKRGDDRPRGGNEDGADGADAKEIVFGRKHTKRATTQRQRDQMTKIQTTKRIDESASPEVFANATAATLAHDARVRCAPSVNTNLQLFRAKILQDFAQFFCAHERGGSRSPLAPNVGEVFLLPGFVGSADDASSRSSMRQTFTRRDQLRH